MITVNFYLAVTFYLIVVIGAVLLAWVLVSLGKKKESSSVDERFIWFCAVCSYTYVNTKGEPFSICQRCGSYNKK